MTEVLIYPLAAFALLAVARAVETATLRDQVARASLLIAAAVLTRVQAVVLVAIFAAAIVVDALLARDRRRLRAFWPVWVVLAVVPRGALISPPDPRRLRRHGQRRLPGRRRPSRLTLRPPRLRRRSRPASRRSRRSLPADRDALLAGARARPAARALIAVAAAARRARRRAGRTLRRRASRRTCSGRDLAAAAAAPLPRLRALARSRRAATAVRRDARWCSRLFALRRRSHPGTASSSANALPDTLRHRDPLQPRHVTRRHGRRGDGARRPGARPLPLRDAR